MSTCLRFLKCFLVVSLAHSMPPVLSWWIFVDSCSKPSLVNTFWSHIIVFGASENGIYSAAIGSRWCVLWILVVVGATLFSYCIDNLNRPFLPFCTLLTQLALPWTVSSFPSLGLILISLCAVSVRQHSACFALTKCAIVGLWSRDSIMLAAAARSGRICVARYMQLLVMLRYVAFWLVSRGVW